MKKILFTTMMSFALLLSAPAMAQNTQTSKAAECKKAKSECPVKKDCTTKAECCTKKAECPKKAECQDANKPACCPAKKAK